MSTLKEMILLILASMLSLSYAQQYQFCTYFSSPMLLEATTTAQEIRIPNNGEGSYRPNEKCEWVLHTRLENHVIKLTVIYREFEGHDVRGDCVADYLDIFDVINKANEFKERLCGRGDEELDFKSTESTMVVHFMSNGRYQYKGFQARYLAYYEKPQQTSLPLGVIVGVSVAALAMMAILCVAVIVCRFRKRKLSERTQRLVHSQVGGASERALSPQTTSLPSYSTDFSPFVHRDVFGPRDPRHDIALSTRPGTNTPPPSYDAIDQGIPLDVNAAPPPSYETVIRESCAMRESSTIEPSAESIAYV